MFTVLALCDEIKRKIHNIRRRNLQLKCIRISSEGEMCARAEGRLHQPPNHPPPLHVSSQGILSPRKSKKIQRYTYNHNPT